MTTLIHLCLMGDHFKVSQTLTEFTNLSLGKLKYNQLEQLRRPELITLFEETTADFVAVADSQLFADLSVLNQLNNLDLSTGHNVIHLVPFSDSDVFIQSLDCLPPVAAFLSMNPLEHALVLIPNSAFSSLDIIPNSADLLWHTLILLSQAGVKNRCLSGNPIHGAAPSHLHLPELAPDYPGPDRNWLKDLLNSYEAHTDLQSISSQADAIALKAGLLCLHDYLDESHQLSQSIENQGKNQTGDYWHHIMHRREPDFSNAKYWSRVVGYHPIHEILPNLVRPLFDGSESQKISFWKERLLLNNRWSLDTFVDFCAECESNQDQELTMLARKIQWIEIQLLLQKTSLDMTTA